MKNIKMYIRQSAPLCKGRASIYQPKLGAGLQISFDAEELDGFVEWKMMGVRDYVLGIVSKKDGTARKEPCRLAWFFWREMIYKWRDMIFFNPYEYFIMIVI